MRKASLSMLNRKEVSLRGEMLRRPVGGYAGLSWGAPSRIGMVDRISLAD